MKYTHIARSLALASLLLAPVAVSGQESNDNFVGPTVVGLRPAPVSAQRSPKADIQIDGRLDDADWATVTPLRGFVQGEPVEGADVEHDTEVRILFSDDAILIAARMWDTDPSSIAAQLVRRDGEGAADWFRVGLDTNLDSRTGYVFQVSAAGVQRDMYLFDDDKNDVAWDAIWESAIAVDDLGWTIEIRIPLSQVRYDASSEPQAWGVNFARRRVASAETSYYALQSRTRRGAVSQFGRLENVLIPNAVRRIEARPYLLSGIHSGPSEAGNPFFDGTDGTTRMGTDLRLGLGSAFTVDATINPDFGQVESDPAQINLGAFETFQQERRPFFVEDANLLDFSLSGMRNSLFYSRRIGRSPTGGALSGSSFSDRPDAATILGAAKLTGRTTGGLSVGGLFAMTQRETARAYFAGDDRYENYAVEPKAQYSVVRLQQDFNGGASQINGIVTGMRRGLPEDGSFDFLNSSAFSAGVNFEHQWGDRTWGLSGTFAGSYIRGDSLSMIRTQRASNHYFQRPDATGESVDSTATSMMGSEVRVNFDRLRGDNWTWGAWAGVVSRGFEINDLGYSSNREKLDAGFRVNYREITPNSVFRSYNVTFFSFHNWSQEALDDAFSIDSWRDSHTVGSYSLILRGELLNYWGGNLDLGYSPNTMSYTATRGGPVMVDPGSARVGLRFNSDRRKAINVSGNVNVRRGLDDSGNQFTLGGGIEFRPSPRLEVSLNPSWSTQSDAGQYVGSTSTLLYDPTFGRRYIFAELERTTLSMQTRLDVTFSPTLTLQMYAQPFLSSGDYLNYRQLENARTYDFVDWKRGLATAGPNGTVQCHSGQICKTADGRQNVDFNGDGTADYSFADRDFNVRSLIGNAVLRWEYRPGSTIFLVWQRQQAASSGVGDFDFRRDIDALFSAPADNVFMIKMNIWLGL